MALSIEQSVGQVVNMTANRPDQEQLGFSDCMGPDLRALVECELLADLNRYLPLDKKIHPSDVNFDWSESCVEGHRLNWLDGEIENFSGIAVIDLDQKLVAEGWMEFIETETGLEVFWWYLRGGDDYPVRPKASNGVPKHIWDKLGDEVRSTWIKYSPTGPQTFLNG
jgi:hypothetical protein